MKGIKKMKRYVKSSKELRKFWVKLDIDVIECNQYSEEIDSSTWRAEYATDDYILAESPEEAWELAKDWIKEQFLQDRDIYIIDSYETQNPKQFIVEYESSRIDSDSWYKAAYYNIVIEEDILTEDGIKERVEVLRL